MKTKVPNNKYADHAVNFINNLTLTGDFSGEPFELLKEQENYVRRLFGHVDKKGKRIYTKSLLFCPSGNGKSQLIAAISLFCLFTFPAGQNIISAASTREQASLIFKMCKQMIENDAYLLSLCEISKTTKTICIPDKYSAFTSISAQHNSIQGTSPSVVLYDELAWAKNDELFGVLTSKQAKRGVAKNANKPLFISLTTAGVFSKTHIAWCEYSLAKRVQKDPSIMPNYLPCIYELDEGDDWEDEKNWYKVNFALDGGFKNIDVMRQEYETAKIIPSRENRFKQEHLNIWCQQASRWMSMEKWQECNIDVDMKELEGAEFYAGLDLAPVKDLSSLVLVAKIDGIYKVLSYFWCSAEDIRTRSKRDKVPYDIWAKQGHIKLTEGDTTDFEQIRKDINEIAEKFRIKTIATDKYSAYQLGQQLMSDGINIEWFRQGFLSMSPPTHMLEKLVLDKGIHLGNNPILDWCAGNVVVLTDPAGNIKADKSKSIEKIDGIIALVQALAMDMHDIESKPSVYKTRGILQF